MQDSIFTKIVKGEIPCHKVYEDDATLAFLDIHPKQPGHTLVISKQQVEFLWDLDDPTYQAVMATCKKVARRLREVISKPYVGEQVMGTDVCTSSLSLMAKNSEHNPMKPPNPTMKPWQK
jgi:histidine triad (HIT) family protein